MFKLRSWFVVALVGLVLTQSIASLRSAEVTEEQRALAQAVLDKLLAFAERPEGYDAWPPVLQVANADVINAFATIDEEVYKRNGKLIPIIIVNRAHIERIAELNPDQLALTLGHEIGHHVLGHVLRNLKISKVAFMAIGRQDELDADQYGLALALEAGFSYQGIMKSLMNQLSNLPGYGGGDEAWTRFLISQANRPCNLPGYSTFEALMEGYTHPSQKDRIAALQQDEVQRRLWQSMSAFDNGIFFLLIEQYANAEFCFQRVTRDFPNCYEAWANLGYARLMRYLDLLGTDDIQEFDLGQLVVGGFYERVESIPMRDVGPDEELWYDAIGALREALRLKPNLILAKTNLAVAHLVHPSRIKDVGTAAKLFDEVAQLLNDAEATRGLSHLARLSLLLNTGVAELGSGDRAASEASFAALLENLQQLQQAEQIGVEGDVLKHAVTYNRALALCGSAEPADLQTAVTLLEDYLAQTPATAVWWPVAYDRYTALCTQLSVAAKSKDDLASSKQSPWRKVMSVELPELSNVALSAAMSEVQAVLGEAAAAVPVVSGNKLKRFLYPQHGLTILGASEVVAIFLTSADAPAVLVRREGVGTEVFEIRVGMAKAELEQMLGSDQPFGTIDAVLDAVDDPEYRFYHKVGLAVKFRGGKVVELVIAPLG